MATKQPIAVCFALEEESGPFRRSSEGKVPMFFTGIGRANANRTVREFLANNAPDLLVTCGFAGGLIPELKIGDVLFVAGESGSKELYDSVRTKLTAAGAREGKIACVDRIATTAKEKQKLHSDTGADAAEMESAAVHDVCRERGIPCVTVRVISDTSEHDLPLDFNNFLKEDKSVDMSKLMMAVAKAPWKMGALMELQKNAKTAANRLAEVLMKLV